MFRNVLIFALCCAAGVAHASSQIPGHPQYKPPDPRWSPARIVFDCTGRDTLTIAPGFATTITDSTVGAPSNFPGYPCAQWPEEGPEHVYRLEITERTILRVNLSEPTGDLDLFLLNDCDTDACLAGENQELVADLDPDTYFLVVDTYGSGTVAGLPYELELIAGWPGVPLQICDPGGATEVDCDLATIPGDLYGQPDLVRTYDCNPGLSAGGEDWYRITAPGLRIMKLEVQARSVGLDPVIWLFDGCGPDAVCLGFVNATLAYSGTSTDGTGSEVLEWPQELELPATVWVAVDCTLPPLAAGEGDYEVIIDCQTVPEEKTSFGSLRALHR
ncbi:MAG: hypothetical protein GY838_19880 [bacterium]|nr:hypothetical protein [bacterium]